MRRWPWIIFGGWMLLLWPLNYWAECHRSFVMGDYLIIATVFVALMTVTWERRIVARERAKRGHVCGKCDYKLTGNVSGVCPECGTRVG